MTPSTLHSLTHFVSSITSDSNHIFGYYQLLQNILVRKMSFSQKLNSTELDKDCTRQNNISIALVHTTETNMFLCDRCGFHSVVPHSHLLFLVTFFIITSGLSRLRKAKPLRLQTNKQRQYKRFDNMKNDATVLTIIYLELVYTMDNFIQDLYN